MKWNRFHDDLPRLYALADILLGAAYADGSFSEDEQIEVGARLIKAMGGSVLTNDLETRVAIFDPVSFDLADALGRLGVDDMRERAVLLADVAAVIAADGEIEAEERSYLWRLAGMLGLKVDDVVALVGPEWPALSTRPAARPRPHEQGRRHGI
jgi:tellurite resistance protein